MAEKYQKLQELPRLDNWDDSVKRWGRGDGKWKNWRGWRPKRKRPWQGTSNFIGDMSSEALGDGTSNVEFEFWIRANISADVWYDMDAIARHKAFNYWRNNIRNDGYYENDFDNDGDYYWQYEEYYYPEYDYYY